MRLVAYFISTNLEVYKAQKMVSRNIMEIWPYCSHQVCIPTNNIQFHGKTGRIPSPIIFSLYALYFQHPPFIFHLLIPSGHAYAVLH